MKTVETTTATQELETIPATGFIDSNNEVKKERRMVQFNERGHLQLSVFSIEQLLQGQAGTEISYANQAAVLAVVNKLARLALSHTYDKPQGYVGIELEYAEVVQLRKFIEARMKHCEQELNTYNKEVDLYEENIKRYMNENDYGREGAEAQFNHKKPTTNFNNSTFVAQKNLLLEIRLWLAGEIVD